MSAIRRIVLGALLALAGCGGKQGGSTPPAAACSASDAPQTRACTVAHGAGTQGRACSGGAWSEWSACAASSCDPDFVVSGGGCRPAPCVVSGVAGQCLETTACAQAANHLSTPGTCSGAAGVACCTPYGLALCDPAVAVDPNAAATTEAAGAGGCPAGMVAVATFCIDRYEASLVRVSDGTAWSPYVNPGAERVRAASVAGAVPQAYVSGTQAAAACLEAGKRLCTDAEWLRACQGPSGTTYPYGSARVEGACNDRRDANPVVQYFGTSDPWIWAEVDDACIDQLPLTLEPAGARAACVSAEGVHDLVGSLDEWTADPAGTFRGGSYVDSVINGAGCSYVTTAHNSAYWDYLTGFRCCADP